MKTRKEFIEYAERRNPRIKLMLLHGVFHEFKGIEHLIGGFCGMKWNGEEWIEK